VSNDWRALSDALGFDPKRLQELETSFVCASRSEVCRASNDGILRHFFLGRNRLKDLWSAADPLVAPTPHSIPERQGEPAQRMDERGARLRLEQATVTGGARLPPWSPRLNRMATFPDALLLVSIPSPEFQKGESRLLLARLAA